MIGAHSVKVTQTIEHESNSQERIQRNESRAFKAFERTPTHARSRRQPLLGQVQGKPPRLETARDFALHVEQRVEINRQYIICIRHIMLYIDNILSIKILSNKEQGKDIRSWTAYACCPTGRVCVGVGNFQTWIFVHLSF